MSLATNVTNLATAVATEVKRNRTWINGNAADLSGLNTTATTDLVSAINEVDGRVDDLSGSAAGIDDGTTTTTSTWSSQHTSDVIDAARTAVEDELPVLTDLIDDTAASTSTVYSSTKTNSQIGSVSKSADTITDGTTNKAFLATERTKLAGIATGATANSTDAFLLDRANHTNTQAASTITGLATVATTGVYTDLTGKPTIPSSYTDLTGTVPQSALPAVALTDYLGEVADETAMLALTGQRGDWATRTDLGTDWQLTADDSSLLASWREMTYPASPVSSVNGRTGAVTGLAEASDVGDLTGFDPAATFAAGLT